MLDKQSSNPQSFLPFPNYFKLNVEQFADWGKYSLEEEVNRLNFRFLAN